MSNNENDDLFEDLSDLEDDLRTNDGPFPSVNNPQNRKNKGKGDLFDDMISIEEEMRKEDRVLHDTVRQVSPDKSKPTNPTGVTHKQGEKSETELFSDLDDLDLNEVDERTIFKKEYQTQPSKTVPDQSTHPKPMIAKTNKNKASEKELFSDMDDLNLNQDDERVIFKKKEDEERTILKKKQDEDTSVKAVLSRIKEKRSGKTKQPLEEKKKSEDLFDDLGDLDFDD